MERYQDEPNLTEAEHLMLDRGVRRLLVLRRSEHAVFVDIRSTGSTHLTVT